MTACDFPELDADGTNVVASGLLDAHHEVIGVSDFGDEISDHCEVCGFAAGWCAVPPARIPDGVTRLFWGAQWVSWRDASQ